MPKFVELWVYLSTTPLFGLTATLVVYVLAQAVYARLQQAPWANPVLWTVVIIAAGLLATGVSYPTYFAGAQFIHFLLGPAVVALAWPLWQRRAALALHWRALLLAALAGGMARGFSLGTAAHGIGAARALQVNADAGAYAGLALGLQVVLASLLIPLAFRLFQA